jgi:hypothetical protein
MPPKRDPEEEKVQKTLDLLQKNPGMKIRKLIAILARRTIACAVASKASLLLPQEEATIRSFAAYKIVF